MKEEKLTGARLAAAESAAPPVNVLVLDAVNVATGTKAPPTACSPPPEQVLNPRCLMKAS